MCAKDVSKVKPHVQVSFLTRTGITELESSECPDLNREFLCTDTSVRVSTSAWSCLGLFREFLVVVEQAAGGREAAGLTWDRK